ncbi:MAG TPA: Clp protease ClpP [Quisquiliibacterium sp.]|nr:Clp protease ClpP [Quisquiliibacterium sp.]
MSTANKWFSIRASARDVRAAEVLIFGDIGESWWGESITAASFVRELAQLDVDDITVRINSHGGSVSDGIAIYNALRRHKARVTTSIEGVAASIASLIAMAGDTVEMAENALLMVHAPWGYSAGNAVDMREFADLLDTWSQAMATSYAAKTGRDVTEMLGLLTDGQDHWYTAAEAKAEQFIDSVVTAVPVAAALDLSRYRALPAAAAAQSARTEPMTDRTAATGGTQPQPVVNEAEIAARALANDKTRRDGIAARFSAFAGRDGVSALQAACQDDTACTIEAAGEKLLAHLAKHTEPLAGTYVATVEDERDKFRSGVSAALMARAGMAKDDPANNFRGRSLQELARASLERAGRRTDGLSKMDLVAAAFTHSTSDFPLLLANVAQKAMMKGYDEAQETFQAWTTKGALPDFKAARRVDLSTFPSLAKVTEGAEYKSATIGERGETIQLATYGRKFSITRQAIINDDLDAFSKIPQRMGRAAIRTVGDLVYAVLTSNPAMADTIALFHADHGNLLTGAAIATSSVDTMRVAMAKQKDGTAVLGIRLAYLIVPVALEGTARVVRDSEFEVTGSKNLTVPNSVRGTFEVISDARLDTASASNWYGAASPSMHDTIEVAYLDGVETPTLEQQSGWDVDGVEFKVRMDAGVKALDFRTMAKNPV